MQPPLVLLVRSFPNSPFLGPFGLTTLCSRGTRRFALKMTEEDYRAAPRQHLTALQRGSGPAVPNRQGREASFYSKTVSSAVFLLKLLPADTGRDFNSCFESVPGEDTGRLSLNILC